MNIKSQKIEFIKVSKRYNKQWIFKNYSNEINNEKINYLIAENGAGKSTLIKMILNLVDYKGKIKTNIKTKTYVPEKINLPYFIKVEDFFNLISLNNDRKDELITKFKIDENKKIKELSKGMKQKIILIQAIAKDVDAYFFDEPLNGLDDESINLFIEEIDKMYQRGKFILISTHQFQRFQGLPNNIVKIN